MNGWVILLIRMFYVINPARAKKVILCRAVAILTQYKIFEMFYVYSTLSFTDDERINYQVCFTYLLVLICC